MQILDYLGRKGAIYKKASVVLSVNAAFETKPFWLITGTSDEDVSNMGSLLSDNSSIINSHVAAVLSDGKVFNIPSFAKK